MDDSKFNLWRATFSFCFIDGFLSPEETSFIEEKLKAMQFTPEQKKTLMSDLKAPPAIDQLLPLITRPADRGFLVNNVRLLSKLDGLSPKEKEKIKSIHDKVMAKIDLTKVSETVAKDEMDSYSEAEVYEVQNKNLYSERIIKNLMKILNPGDYKFPRD